MTIQDARTSHRHPRAGPMRVVGLGPSKDPNAKLTLVLLGASGARVAVKLATTAQAATALEAERAALVSIRARCHSYDVLQTMPEPRPDLFWNGYPALITTAVRGAPMSTHYHRRRHTARHQAVEKDFASSTQWLGALQKSTAGSTARVDFAAGIVEPLCIRYADDLLLPGVLPGLMEVTEALGQHRTPRTAVHGDFWCGNILMDKADVSGVVDWEAATARGEPLRDVARFALSYALYLDRHTRPGQMVDGHPGLVAGPWGAGLTHALFGDGWFPELFRSYLADGLRRLGADPGAWRMLALAGLAEVAATADHPGFARCHLGLLHGFLARPQGRP